MRKLQEKRRDVLREALEVREKLAQSARCTVAEVLDLSRRLLTAELDLAATNGERIAAYERHLEKIEAYIKLAKAKLEAGRGGHADVLDAQDSYLEAKIGWLKAGGKLKKAEK